MGYVNPANIEALRRAIVTQAKSGTYAPAVYVVEPVSRCNLKCVMCPNPKMDSANWGDMTEATFERVTRDIAPYCEFLMLYWMGEPTLHPQIETLLQIARRNIAGKIVLSTNVTQMSPTLARAILANTDVVLCCIDRWDKGAYERVRRGAVFENTVRNTELLLSSRVPTDTSDVVVKALDIAQGSYEYVAFQAYWSERGATPLLAWLNDWAGTFGSMRNAATLPIPLKLDSRVPCSDLWFKMVMNWRGEVQLCCFDWNYRHNLGRFSDSDPDWVRQIWQSEALVRFREAHAASSWNTVADCEACTTWGTPAELDAYVDFSRNSYFTVF